MAGKFAQFFTRKAHREYAEKVAEQVRIYAPAHQLPDPLLPFALVVTTHPGTRKDGGARVLRGDVDNLAKLVADALQGILYEDDKQAVLILGAEGNQVAGMGLQTINIVWLPEDAAVGIATEATGRLLTALELGGYVEA